MADFLIEHLKKSNLSEIKIFRENIESGIKIYTQLQGAYINGSVILQHTLVWKPIPEYKLSK